MFSWLSMKRLKRILLGCLLLLVGIAGVALPVVPGTVFLAMGGMVLSKDVRVLASVEKWIVDRFPEVRKALDRLRKRFPLLSE